MSVRTTVVAALAAVAVAAGVIIPVPDDRVVAAIPEDIGITTSFVDGSDREAWSYTGSWEHASGHWWTEGEHDDSESYSRVAGARATLQFWGTGVTLVGPTGSNGGLFRVTLDCGTVVEGSSYSPSKVMKQSIASFDDLMPGFHTLVVEVLGTPAPGSSDSFVMIDVATVVHDTMATYSPPRQSSSVLALRRPGCGAASDLVTAHRVRAGESRFTLESGATALDLPDAPRTLQLAVQAGSSSAQFAVADANGDFYPAIGLVGAAGAMSAEATSEAISIPAGASADILIDLRGPTGAGSASQVQLVAFGAEPIEVIAGRTSDLAVSRLARQLNNGVSLLPELPGRIAAPADAFRHGPVVLSRVLADADQPAWSTATGAAVPLIFGAPIAGAPPRAGKVPLPADTIGVQIPASGESVRIRLDTSRRCRTLTASVTIDDRSPEGAWADLAVYGDGQLLQAHHNGLWQPSLEGKNPAISGSMREWLAKQLRDAKYSIGATAYASDAESLATYRSIVLAEFEAMSGTARDRSAAAVSYPLESPIRFGAGSTVNRGAPVRFTPPNQEAGAERTAYGWVSKSVAVTPIDPRTPVPISVDLIAPHMMSIVRHSASHNLGGAQELGHVLVGTAEIVVSGTPGAVLDLVGAGLDCVTVDPAADGTAAPRYAMPTFSQIGIPPLFLPAPRDESGHPLTELGMNPLWWDLACPNGPSTAGPTFTATRERYSSYGVLGWNGRDYHQIEVHEVATASKPACGLPADQARDQFGSYSLASGSRNHPPSDSSTTLTSTVRDPLADKLVGIDGTWRQKLGVWGANTVFEASHDQLGLAVWLALAPLDLPAALVFNPFVAHGAPVEAQIVLGAAFLGASAFTSGLAKAIPGASGLSAGARTSLESTGEILLLTQDQVAAAKAAGLVGVIKIGDEVQLVVPLRSGSRAADLAPRLTAVKSVTTDAAVSRLPVTNDVAPWVGDAPALREAESARVCKRDVEMFCPGRVPGQGVQYSGVNHLGVRFPLGFAERYPGVRTSYAFSGTEATQAAHNSLVMRYDVVDPLLAAVRVESPGGAVSNLAPAFSTDTLPLYHFSDLPPATVFGTNPTGFRVNQTAMGAYLGGDTATANLLVEVREAQRASKTSLYVTATRDPDWLAAGYFKDGLVVPHWRYVIARPVGGGGIDVLATLRQTAAPASVQKLAQSQAVAAMSEVALPGGVLPEYIVRADYMEFDPATRSFYVSHSVDNSLFQAQLVDMTHLGDALPTGAELWGSRVLSPYDIWARFDWVPESFGDTLTVPAPPAGATGQNIFTKAEGVWRRLPAMSNSQLVDAGFRRGTYPGQNGVYWIPSTNGHPLSTVNATGWVAQPVPPPSRPARGVDEGSPRFVTVSRQGAFLVDTGRDYAVTPAGSGVHDLGSSSSADGGRWQLEELSDTEFRLINPSLGTALQITNEWHGDPTLGRHVVVGSPTGWNNAYQRWTLESGDEGAIVFRSVTSPGLTLQVAEDGAVVAGPSEDASVRQWIMQAAP